MLRTAGWIFGLSFIIFCCDCSSDSDSDSKSPADHDAGDAASEARPVDAFNGDCTTARWASVSDACWSCFCSKCKESLNACDEKCVKGIACAAEKHTLVGVASDLQCELRAFGALCATDPDILASSGALVAFDGCLIDNYRPPEHLRACEAECGVVYTGDVCERFPDPDAG